MKICFLVLAAIFLAIMWMIFCPPDTDIDFDYGEDDED